MAWVWLVVLGVCAHMVYLAAMVGKARGTYNVQAPAMTGDEMFERHNRVHQNSVEQAVVFFPLLAACAWTGATTVAAILGAVYLIGRVLYAQGYVTEPSQRGKGMMIGFLAQVVLFLVALFNVIASMF